MKKKVLPAAFSVLIFFMVTCGLAQDYDLIVTTKGDSIACRIDSITESHIYFEMKNMNSWAHTHIDKAEVSEYKQHAIHKKQFVFKSGTSIIESPKQLPPASMRDVQKNSMYIEYHILSLSAFYERSIPIANKAAIIAGGGINQGVAFSTETNLAGKFAFILGGEKHFFECGTWIVVPGNDLNTLVPLAGYRYQSTGGFLLRVDFTLVVDSGTYLDTGEDWMEAYPIPGIALGYSF